MSLLKWSLAMAGTAMAVRYLSDRHRERLADADGNDFPPQIDRDDATQRVNDTGSTGNGSGMGSGSRSSTAASDGFGGIASGGTLGLSTGTSSDDLLSPGSTTPPLGTTSGSY